MLPDRAPMRDWLKARRTANDLHLDLMTLCYDLDGAVAADQLGLAWWAQEELLHTGVRLFLWRCGVGIAPPPDEDRVSAALHAMATLERVNPALAVHAWRLWLRPLPSWPALPTGIDETMAFIAEDLGMPWVRSRQEAVRQWAADTQALRAVARAFGVARSDDWYLTSAPTGPGTADWYDDVLRNLAEEHAARAAR